MPTYEYACADCGHGWEEIQKISEAPVELCPSCHKSTAKRQISGGNFILKGGGWYADLYSSSSNKGKSGGDGEKSSSTSEAKPAEAKPAETKTESKTTSAAA
jgi:putative FmdB family regulatory protein